MPKGLVHLASEMGLASTNLLIKSYGCRAFMGERMYRATRGSLARAFLFTVSRAKDEIS